MITAFMWWICRAVSWILQFAGLSGILFAAVMLFRAFCEWLAGV